MQNTRLYGPRPGTGPSVRPVAATGRPATAAVPVGGIPIFDGDLPAAVAWCLDMARRGEGARVATANLDFFALARRNRTLHEDLQRASLVVADGAPVAWLARLAGGSRTRRIAGVDLVRELCAAGAAAGEFRVALYGAAPDVCGEAATHIEATTGAKVTAAVSPPFRPLSAAERSALVGQLVAGRPHLVLVALGCPAQERFIAESCSAIPGAVWIGVGGTLDFFAGRKTRAPRAAQAVGLEWFVRFAQEPRRLGPRYFGRDIPEVARLAAVTAAGRVRRVSRPGPVALIR